MTDPDFTRALDRVDALQAELDALRPLADEQVGRAMQRLRLEWTYHSNAIEGNSLTYGETRALLMHGVTAQGKPLKDHLDIRRHGEAITYIEDFIRSDEPVRVDLIKEIHLRLMGEEYEITAETPNGDRVKRTVRGGVYKEHPNNVRTETGETHFYADPLEVPGRMAELAKWLDSDEAEELHPVARAALFHHRFVEIHPFPDGNGRTSRMLMNILLMREGFIPAVIRQENRPAYYGALAAADGGDPQPVVAFVANELAESMDLYVRAVKGEPDPTVFARRIGLLRREIETLPETDILSAEIRAAIGEGFTIPLLETTTERMKQLASLFSGNDYVLHVEDSNGSVVLLDRQAFDALKRGDWIAFSPFWRLQRLKRFPDFSFRLSYSGSLSESAFVLKSSALTQEWHFPPSRLPSLKDVEEITETVFDTVLEEIEQRIRAGE